MSWCTGGRLYCSGWNCIIIGLSWGTQMVISLVLGCRISSCGRIQYNYSNENRNNHKVETIATTVIIVKIKSLTSTQIPLYSSSKNFYYKPNKNHHNHPPYLTTTTLPLLPPRYTSIPILVCRRCDLFIVIYQLI